jgi:DNA-binding XRE family transcriptional regulator
MAQQNSTNNKFTAKHREYMEILADPTESRTKEEIAKHFGVERTTLWYWEKIPGFWDGVNDLTKLHTCRRMPKAWDALMTTAEGGGKAGVAAMNTILKHRGELIEKTKDVSDRPPQTLSQEFIVIQNRDQLRDILKAKEDSEN